MAARELTSEQWAQRLEVAHWERDRARAQSQAIVEILSGIHALLDPAPVQTPDGRTLRFVNPMAAEVLHELSARIRAVPEQIAAARAGAPNLSDPLVRVLAVVNRYLPPGGCSAEVAMREIVAIVDPWPITPQDPAPLARARVLPDCPPGKDPQDHACDMRQAAFRATSGGN